MESEQICSWMVSSDWDAWAPHPCRKKSLPVPPLLLHLWWNRFQDNPDILDIHITHMFVCVCVRACVYGTVMNWNSVRYLYFNHTWVVSTWLVVSTPLNNICHLGLLFPIIVIMENGTCSKPPTRYTLGWTSFVDRPGSSRCTCRLFFLTATTRGPCHLKSARQIRVVQRPTVVFVASHTSVVPGWISLTISAEGLSYVNM